MSKSNYRVAACEAPSHTRGQRIIDAYASEVVELIKQRALVLTVPKEPGEKGKRAVHKFEKDELYDDFFGINRTLKSKDLAQSLVVSALPKVASHLSQDPLYNIAVRPSKIHCCVYDFDGDKALWREVQPHLLLPSASKQRGHGWLQLTEREHADVAQQKWMKGSWLSPYGEQADLLSGPNTYAVIYDGGHGDFFHWYQGFLGRPRPDNKAGDNSFINKLVTWIRSQLPRFIEAPCEPIMSVQEQFLWILNDMRYDIRFAHLQRKWIEYEKDRPTLDHLGRATLIDDSEIGTLRGRINKQYGKLQKTNSKQRTIVGLNYRKGPFDDLLQSLGARQWRDQIGCCPYSEWCNEQHQRLQVPPDEAEQFLRSLLPRILVVEGHDESGAFISSPESISDDRQAESDRLHIEYVQYLSLMTFVRPLGMLRYPAALQRVFPLLISTSAGAGKSALVRNIIHPRFRSLYFQGNFQPDEETIEMLYKLEGKILAEAPELGFTSSGKGTAHFKTVLTMQDIDQRKKYGKQSTQVDFTHTLIFTANTAPGRRPINRSDEACAERLAPIRVSRGDTEVEGGEKVEDFFVQEVRKGVTMYEYIAACVISFLNAKCSTRSDYQKWFKDIPKYLKPYRAVLINRDGFNSSEDPVNNLIGELLTALTYRPIQDRFDNHFDCHFGDRHEAMESICRSRAKNLMTCATAHEIYKMANMTYPGKNKVTGILAQAGFKKTQTSGSGSKHGYCLDETAQNQTLYTHCQTLIQ